MVLTIAVAVWSVPINRSQRPAMPLQLQSLTDLDRIGVGFARPLPDELRNVGLSEQKIVATCVKALLDAGFGIVTDKDIPQWRLAAILATDDQTPKQRGYRLLATLDQSVHVHQLDHAVVLSTYVDLVVGLNGQDGV